MPIFPELTVEHTKGRRERLINIFGKLFLEYKEKYPDMHEVVDLGNSSDIEEITIDLS